jgi:hypothetical protein
MKTPARLSVLLLSLGTLTAASAAPWTFALFCDGRTYKGEAGGKDGVNMTAVHAIAADIASLKPDLVIFPGDLVNGDAHYGPLSKQFATWKEAMAPLAESGIPVYMSRGNHDVKQDTPKGAAEAAWKEAFPQLPRNGPPGEEGLSYFVDHENAEFIACEQFKGIEPGFRAGKADDATNHGMVSPWVIDRVKNSPARWVFVFGHESAFIGHHEDCMANFSQERDALWDALGKRGGVYLAGHDHMYIRRTAPDITGKPVLELVVGCGGATPYPYDNSDMNATLDRHARTTDAFINAKPGGKPNTGGFPMYFGYVLFKVDGDRITGVWRAFTNYDTKTFTGPVAPEKPRFEALDAFSWPET